MNLAKANFYPRTTNGENRFIFNLKKLNKFIHAPHFKLEDIKTAKKLITKDCFLTKIDMKESYFLIPIYKKHKKFLRFSFKGQLFQFDVLPFGLCTAPYVFTKLLKPVVEKLRSSGWLSVIYLDDILMIAQSEQKMLTTL